MRDVRALWARVSSAAHASQFGLHSLRVSGYNAAKAGKKGVQLAVAQGGWMSAAHERYERFDMSDVMALTSEIAQQADVEGSSDLTLQRQSAVPANAACDNASPRPMRPVSKGSGSRRGVLRRMDGSSPQANTIDLDESRDQRVLRCVSALRCGGAHLSCGTREQSWRVVREVCTRSCTTRTMGSHAANVPTCMISRESVGGA